MCDRCLCLTSYSFSLSRSSALPDPIRCVIFYDSEHNMAKSMHSGMETRTDSVVGLGCPSRNRIPNTTSCICLCAIWRCT
ncbi:hypothetical protein JB92DRAFT_2200198 [Gautieria morchelliformis]|nr:hypothetical protein JB92DRAFT_2200198 [Gautieria morchelliformis]